MLSVNWLNNKTLGHVSQRGLLIVSRRTCILHVFKIFAQWGILLNSDPSESYFISSINFSSRECGSQRDLREKKRRAVKQILIEEQQAFCSEPLLTPTLLKTALWTAAAAGTRILSDRQVRSFHNLSRIMWDEANDKVPKTTRAWVVNDAGKGEKHRNKEKEKQGEKIEKLYISGRGKSWTKITTTNTSKEGQRSTS